LNKTIQYLKDRREDKLKKEEEKKRQDMEKEIDDTCNNGSLGDLIDVVRKYKKTSLLIFSLVLCGCVSDEITVETTKEWENHYMSERDFYNGTNGIKLDKGESIWVISNKTLSRLLKAER